MACALSGCISPYTETGTPEGSNISVPGTGVECTTVVTQVPYNETVCQNVSRMEQVCENRELNYSLSPAVKTDMCSSRDLCVNYYANGTCATAYCSKAVARCRANLTNLDSQRAGTWTVSANFTLDGSVFTKDPVAFTLLPGESRTADFTQFYDMDLSQLKPTCSIFVVSKARLQDCGYVTRITEECQDVTKYSETEKQVCG